MRTRAVWSLPGRMHLAEVAAKALDWPLMVDGPLGDTEVALVVGAFDAPYFTRMKADTARAESRIIHWCGPDAYLLNDPAHLPEARHTCESESVRLELARRGVEARVAPLPAERSHAPLPLPAHPQVAVYLGDNPMLYGINAAQAAIECLPGVEMVPYLFGELDDAGIARLVADSSAHLCLSAFPWGARSAREFMAAGRRAVVTEDVPHAAVVAHDDLPAIVSALRDALAQRDPDAEASAYWREADSGAAFRASIEEVL